MSVFYWPPSVLPQSTTWWYHSPSRNAISPLDGDLTILAQPGDRWMCQASFAPITDERRQEMMAFIPRLRHQYNQLILPPHFYKRNGSLPATCVNLAPDGGRFDVIGPWVAVSSNAFIDSGMLCVRNVGAAAGHGRSGEITVTSGISYLLRVECLRGSSSAFRIWVGTAPGTSNILDSGSLGEGVFTGRFTPPGTAIHVTFICNTAVTDEFCFFDNLVIERCGRIATSAYLNSRDNVVISDLPATTFGLLQKGDMIEVNGELKGLLHGLFTKSDGSGYVTFNPPTRTAIALNSPVVIGSPYGRFNMQDDPMKFTTQKYFDTAFSVSFIEDIST
jgi:hypothetical protein